MLMTETMPTLATGPLDISATTTVAGEMKPRRVHFAENVAAEEARIHLGKASDLWYSKLDLKLFKQKSKALSNHIHLTSPYLTQEIERAYYFTRARKEEGSDQLFPQWHKLGSSRRGLERFVLSKDRRTEQANEVKASRSIVFNLQCLLKRSPAVTAAQKDQHAEMIRQQYCAFAQPALQLALIHGTKDAEVVQPYYKDQDDDEEEEELEDLILDDGILSVGSISSRDSRNSMSAKKLKPKKKSSDDASTDSDEKKKKKKKKSDRRRKSSDGSKLPRGTSPMRRIKSLDLDLECPGRL